MRTGYRSVWSAHEVNFGPANRILFLSGPSVRRKVGSPIVWRDQGVAGEMPVHQQCHPNTDQTRTKRTVIAQPQIPPELPNMHRSGGHCSGRHAHRRRGLLLHTFKHL